LKSNGIVSTGKQSNQSYNSEQLISLQRLIQVRLGDTRTLQLFQL